MSPEIASSSASTNNSGIAEPSDVKAVKARRASRPKVKTGCNNCKNRRVKCDETRPQCIKCVKSGRHCEGYPAYKRTVEIAIPIAPRPREYAPAYSSNSSNASTTPPPAVRTIMVRKPPPRPIQKHTPPPTPVATQAIVLSSPTLYQPKGLAFDAQEGQYFQVFRTKTASELSGFFDSDFWTRSVLQESHSEASIRHAVVALGALYKTLEKVAESPPSSPGSADSANPPDSAPSHYNFALQQYGKALTHLRESLQNNENRSQRTILMSIVLFTCFQSFTGDHKAAIMQIQSGLGLLEERRQDSKQPFIRQKEDVVEDELVQMFTRLAVQAKSYDMAFHFPHPYVIQLSPQRKDDHNSPQSSSSPSDAASTSSLETNIPEVFTNSREARAALDSLCERILRFNEQLSAFNPGPNNILPAHLVSRGAGFRLQLQQWSKAFEPLLDSRKHRGVTITERAGINVLKMIHNMTSILFLMGFSTSEMGFDGFTPHMKEIVELAQEVVVDEELSLAAIRCGDLNNCRHRQNQPSRVHQHEFPGLAAQVPAGYKEESNYSHIKASFALDLGIVPPLFVVATKCRDRKLRREAIGLLMSSPRREGMWDSILCGKVSQWIMEVEEEGMRRYDVWDPTSVAERVGMEKRVMVKEILFDLQRREALIRCGTRGTNEGDLDWKAKETNISW